MFDYILFAYFDYFKNIYTISLSCLTLFSISWFIVRNNIFILFLKASSQNLELYIGYLELKYILRLLFFLVNLLKFIISFMFFLQKDR